MSVKQVSIFIEDKPGKMDEMTTVLAANNINMRAISVAQTDGFGIARIIVDDVYEATTVLKDAGYVNKLTHVVIVEIPNVPGGLNKVLKVFTEANINIKYMYAVSGANVSEQVYMIFRVDDYKLAESALAKAGLKVITEDQVPEL